MTEHETCVEKRLAAARQEIMGWRAGRAKLGPLSAQLWAEAIALTGEVGVASGVARDGAESWSGLEAGRPKRAREGARVDCASRICGGVGAASGEDCEHNSHRADLSHGKPTDGALE